MSTRLSYRITMREAAAMLASLNVATEPYHFVARVQMDDHRVALPLVVELNLCAEATELGLTIKHITEQGQPRVEYWLSVPTLAGD
jgi:hypothetical protein